MINVNGKNYSGRSLKMVNNRIFIDGKDMTPDSKEVIIIVNGNIDELIVDVCNVVAVKGDVKSAKTSSGNLTIEGSVGGNATTSSGDIKCGSVTGNLQTSSGDITMNGKVDGDINTTSGNVTCGDVGGSVTTRMGNIKKRL